jgi:hypothetical protein
VGVQGAAEATADIPRNKNADPMYARVVLNMFPSV